MTSQLVQAFRKGKTALIPFITAGDPDLEQSGNIIKALARNGADIIEIGVPFSDSLADGPVIQESFLRSLKAGTTIYKIFGLCRKLRTEGITTPFVMMVSCNIPLRLGLETFFQKAQESGINGVILPDAPLEESAPFKEAAEKYDIANILLAAPTSGHKRAVRIAEESEGFLYAISSLGITGERNSFAQTLKEEVTALQKETSLPVCVGFGISNAQQAQKVGTFADGVIIGSALVKLISQSPPEKAADAAGLFTSDIRHALDRAS